MIDGKEYAVDRVFIHPDWRERGPHDIGLLRLGRPAETIEPAALYRKDNEVGQIATIVGSGDFGTGVTGPTTMDKQKRGATNRIEEADADWLYFTFDPPESATPLEGVSGPGDSGGPAFIEVDGTPFVAGVSVFGANGKPGRYGTREGYARVSAHIDWIESIVSGKNDSLGLAPNSAGEPDGGVRQQVVRRAPSGTRLADVAGGRAVQRYLDAFNSGDDKVMASALSETCSPAFLDRKSDDEHTAFYHRLLDDELGKIKLVEVIEASKERIVIRVTGEEWPEAELHFEFDAAGKVSKLMIAKVDKH